MPKNRDREKPEEANGMALLRSGRSWTVFSLLLLVVVAGYVGKLAWQQQRNRLFNHPRFVPKFQVTPDKPDWIENDIVDSVIRDGSLDEISLLDEQATKQIAAAFEMHPWVRQVDHVSKHANGIVKVNLAYRRPAGFVKVDGGHFPVDADAKLLPVDVAISVVRGYPRIEVGAELPLGVMVGEKWDDARVIGAAEIAAAFAATWKDLELFAVVYEPAEAVDSQRSGGVFLLRTDQQHRILWGSAPGQERNEEASTDTKVRRLVEYIRSAGPLKNLDPKVEIDLTHPETIRISSRVAP